MKVKQLIEELSKYNPNLDVRIWADHGQVFMGVDMVNSQCSTEGNEYMIEGTFETSGEYYEEYGEDSEPPYEFVNIWGDA